MKINIWTFVKIIFLILTFTLITLDLLKIIPVEWERLVSVGGLLSAFSVPVINILEKFGFKVESKSGKEGVQSDKSKLSRSSENPSDTNKSRSE